MEKRLDFILDETKLYIRQVYKTIIDIQVTYRMF